MGANLTTRTTPARRRAAFLRATLPHESAARAAAWLLVADGAVGLAFAASLACLIGRLAATGRPALRLAAASAALLLVRGLLAEAAISQGARAAARARHRVRANLARALLRRPSDRPVGEIATLVCDTVEALHAYVARYRPARFAAGVVPMLVGLGVALASPISAAILFATLIPFTALMILAGGAAAEQSHRQLTALSRLSGLFADRLRQLPTILAFNAEAREAETLAAAADELRRRTMGVLRIAFISTGGLEFFAALSVALVAVYAGFTLLHLLPFAHRARLDLRRAVFVLAAAPEFYAPLRRLAAAYHDQQAAETAADRLMPILETEAAAAATSLPPPRLAAPPSLGLHQLCLHHPGAPSPAVRDVSLFVPAGKIGVLLGPSGSGKSTILHALLGLVPLSGGAITINGTDLAAIGSLAGAVGWLGQTTLLVPGTLAENLALALPARTADAASLRAAAEAAGLGPLLARRPDGLNTRLDERGSGLSGGERRRIGLARAWLAGAPLLLLDEPSAHLDAASEQALVATLRAAAGPRTLLIATHSPALAAIADVVLRLG